MGMAIWEETRRAYYEALRDPAKREELKSELTGMFDDHITALRQEKDAIATYERFTANHPEPIRGKVYDSIDGYLDYCVTLDNWAMANSMGKGSVETVRQRCKNTASAIIKRLPAGVWFKHGNVGIGVSYTDWGGGKYDVMVSQWDDEKMPNLDHRCIGG